MPVRGRNLTRGRWFFVSVCKWNHPARRATYGAPSELAPLLDFCGRHDQRVEPVKRWLPRAARARQDARLRTVVALVLDRPTVVGYLRGRREARRFGAGRGMGRAAPGSGTSRLRKHPMRPLTVLTALACATALAPGQDDARPASSNVRGAEYPRVHPDLKVTFRLKAS